MTRLILAAVILAFGLLAGYALEQHGYWGIIDYHFHSSAGWQVLTDLVITCTVVARWIVLDARRTGRNPWPYLLLILVLGSFGPQFYLLLEKRDDQRASRSHLQATGG